MTRSSLNIAQRALDSTKRLLAARKRPLKPLPRPQLQPLAKPQPVAAGARLRFITLAAIASIFVLSACQTLPDIKDMPDGQYGQSLRHIPDVAATPLYDLNIGRKAMPERLARLQNPYGTDTVPSCTAITHELRALHTALALNQPKSAGSRHSRQTRAGHVGNAADVTTKALATSLIPFRGVVRLASGATYRDKAATEADRKGRERVGFLMGLGSANRCPGFRPPLVDPR